MKNGVLYRDGALPNQPGREWFFHLETLRGSIKLPPEIALLPKPPKRPSAPACLRDGKSREDWSDADKDEVDTYQKAKAKHGEEMTAFWLEWHRAIVPVFEHVKQRGFPNDENGDYRYEFDVCCSLPDELNPAEDPPHKRLLPVPQRELTNVEKMAILAAIYDAHWRGSEKIAPWGVSDDGEGPDPWPSEAERDERRAALGYYFLFREAEQLDTADLPVVRSWLEELRLPLQSEYTIRVPSAVRSPNLQADDVPPSPKPPSDKAWQAWRLGNLLGISKQTEIATTLVQHGTPATQGQVSKWLREVEDFLKAGGIAPKMDGLPSDDTLAGKPGSYDPSILDMGQRQGGEAHRPHQQRLRRDPDSTDK